MKEVTIYIIEQGFPSQFVSDAEKKTDQLNQIYDMMKKEMKQLAFSFNYKKIILTSFQCFLFTYL